MTSKEKLITNFLKRNQGKAFYLDLYDSLVFDFEDDEEFNFILDGLVNIGIICTQDLGETLYTLNESKLKK